jgi:alpha-beta hydrolase superfamily lysophospholipase
MARHGTRIVKPDPPAEIATHHGLAYARYEPKEAAVGGGVVVLHGAGSCKESHFDFCRTLRGAGVSSIAFDIRGHGDSEGPLDGRGIDDVLAIADLLPRGPRALRGSSMGGYFALLAAGPMGACAVAAVCPAPPDLLRAGLRAGRFEFRADGGELDALFAAHDDVEAVCSLRASLLLLHAEGDEQVPVAHSRALLEAARARQAGVESRLIAVPGGHHRSLQHDPELQALSARFLLEAMKAAAA